MIAHQKKGGGIENLLLFFVVRKEVFTKQRDKKNNNKNKAPLMFEHAHAQRECTYECHILFLFLLLSPRFTSNEREVT